MLYAIGDIHGHLDALEAAMAQVDLSGGNRLVLLGDYIDGGPQSGAVLRYIYALQQRRGPEKVVVLRGNHEEELLEWLSACAGPGDEPDACGRYDWLRGGRSLETLRSLVRPSAWIFFKRVLPTLSEDSQNIVAARLVRDAIPELLTWLRGLPYYHETPQQIFVHAGIDEESGDWWPAVTPEYMFVGKYPAETGPFYKDIVAGHVGTSSLADDPSFHGVYWDGESHYYIDGSIQRGGKLNVLRWDAQKGYRQWDDGWREIT